MNKKQRLKELNKIIKEKRKGISKLCDERNKIEKEFKEKKMKKLIGKCFVYSYFDEDYDGNRKKIFSYSKVVGVKYGMHLVIDVSEDIHGKITIKNDLIGESYFDFNGVKEVNRGVFEKKFNEMIEELKK